MESALDFHRVPFVHGAYTPGVGQQLADIEPVDHVHRIAMTARLAMFVDFKLFQRQDRAMVEALGPSPRALEHMNLIPADTGAERWIWRWRTMLEPQPDYDP